MTANISVNNNVLNVEIQGIHKILAFKSKLEVPLKHVVKVYIDENVVKGWSKGLKAFGINIPNLITAGTFYKDGDKVFWDVCNTKKAIVIELRDNDYSKLIIEVKNPEESRNLINSYLSAT